MSVPSAFFSRTALAALSLGAVACERRPDAATLPADTVAAAVPADTTSYVTARALPGRRVELTVRARGRALYLDTCNDALLVNLHREDGTLYADWIAAMDACRSPDVVIPQNSARAFVTEFAHVPDSLLPAGTGPYRLSIGNLMAAPSPDTVRLALERRISNAVTLRD